MKEEKKPGSRTFYRVGFCLLVAVVFLTVSLQSAAQEKTVFTGNAGLLNHYGNDNSLFSQGYWSGADMSNQEQIQPIKDKPRVSGGKLFGEIFMGMLGNIGGGFLGALFGSQLTKDDDEEWFEGLDGLVLGYFTGSTFGSAFGVYVAGNSGDAQGSFGSALLGSILGEGAAILVLLLTKDGNSALISFIALPPIGSALLFNSSLKSKKRKSTIGEIIDSVVIFFRLHGRVVGNGKKADIPGYMKKFFSEYDAIDPRDGNVVPRGFVNSIVKFYEEKYEGDEWAKYGCREWVAVILHELWERVVRGRETFAQKDLPIKIQLTATGMLVEPCQGTPPVNI